MDVLIAAAGMLIPLLAFTAGFLLGRGAGEEKVPPTVPAKPDEAKRLTYEADQQALADCLNYSIDVAYGDGRQ